MDQLEFAEASWPQEHPDGRWLTRDLRRRASYIVNGVPLGSLVEDLPENLVTPFEGLATAEKPAAVLLGDAPYAEWLPTPARVPLLVCPCGDLLCGAITVRVTRTDASVRWSDWASENFYSPAEVLDLPTYEFSTAEYGDFLRAATELALRDDPISVRVRQPRNRLRGGWKFGFERTDPDAMRDWLVGAEAVRPTIAEADGSYFEFLVALDAAQSLVASAGRLERLSPATRLELTDSLTTVVDSEHVLALPVATKRAVEWFLEHLDDA